LATGGRLARYTVAQLDRFSINVHTVADRQQLAVRYGINPTTLQSEAEGPKEWKAVQLNLPEFVDRRSVDWGLRAIEESLSKDKANLVIIVVDARGGDLDSCLRLAKYLGDFDPERVRTSVYIKNQARGPAALIPLSADHLIMSETSILGGNYEPPLNESELAGLDEEFRRLANNKDRDAVMFKAMLNPKIELSRWRHEQTGQVRMMTNSEQAMLTDSASWLLLSPVDLSEGLTGKQAEQDGIARSLLASVDELSTFYQLDAPAKQLTPTRTDRMIETFARFLASPIVAGWLLFGAMFFLSTEMSTPGVGVPGILGTLCVVLFFWSQYLDGNADWLEILLFVVGVGFILMELFIFPGTIVLGVGGLLMVVLSIVLATQTFLIPRNSQELARLPVSLGIVCAALSGGVVALYVLRKYLPNAPFFKRIMLDPPVSNRPFGNEFDVPEEFDVLVGQRGVAVTRLVPSGKARFANKYVDVMTEGLIVDPQTKIEVIEVVGNRVLVRPVEKD
jgi:membrane-bound ClpP family serine protease